MKEYPKRLNFDDPKSAWFWVVPYVRKSGYNMSLRYPLSKTIYSQLRNIISPKVMSSRDLYNAVGFHVHSIKYLECIQPNKPRLNLFGKVEGKVTFRDYKYAQRQLALHHKNKKPEKKVTGKTLSLKK